MLNKNKKKRLHTVRSHFPKLQKCHLLQSWQEPKWCLGTETVTGQERPVTEMKKWKHQHSCGHTTRVHESHYPCAWVTFCAQQEGGQPLRKHQTPTCGPHVNTHMQIHPQEDGDLLRALTNRLYQSTLTHENSPGSYKLLADTVEGKDSRPSSEPCWIPLSLLLTMLREKKWLVMKVHTTWKADSHNQQDRKMSWHMKTWTWPPPA